ncbi:MAG: GAF domain-containing protein [Ktedonobacteraceae bacterium]|nr:GAF domain-containing protein [Ktedonobacteraceae bacterium]
MKDLITPGTDFTPRLPDLALTQLANMVVRLGGTKADGQDRWRFCYILLPENLHLPLQQRNLVVQAMSQNIRHAIGITMLTPERYRTSISIRAFQSGHIIYRQELATQDMTPETRAIEGPVCSNIAVPIGGEAGEPLGVIYVASYHAHAFSEQDCCILRLIARMLEEFLGRHTLQRKLTENLVEVMKDPEQVDPSFKEFGSENDFIFDIEKHLEHVQSQMAYELEKGGGTKNPVFSDTKPLPGEISFIAIDIDDQDRIARDYDEKTLRNLQKTIGQRIRDLLPALFTRYVDCKLYYIYAGRFYLFLRDFSPDVTRRKAEHLKKALEGSIALKQSDIIGSTLIIPNVSLHLAVGWYSYQKLKEFLEIEQYHTIADISSTIYRSLDSVLKLGMDDGGDVIYAWDPETATFGIYQSGDAIR